MKQNQPTTGAYVPEETPVPGVMAPERFLCDAFDLLPDAVFVFDGARRLVRANSASKSLQEIENGDSCCQMFWHVEGAESCVVDRAIECREQVEVEISIGTDARQSIEIIVQPLQSAGNSTGALV